MSRSTGIVLVMGCLAVMGSWPAEAKDHPIAKSLTKPGSSLQAGVARTCAGEDVLGNWELVRFDSSYRFRNPQAPYLFPHQVFQYSNQGGAKSLHSLYPIVGDQATVFEAVPLDMTYHIERRGRVVLTVRGRDEPIETWSCEIVTRGHLTAEGGSAVQRGDLIMTLLGSGGQALFVRHLRRSPS
jgi:hypothetical protein